VELNGFNRIALFYDSLARMVYGKSIVESQKHFLNKIHDQSKILILGGGTGWILAEIFKVKSNAEVYYIEASSKMISLAKEEITNEQVHFIHGTENDIPPQIKFDLVITNFYLDLFSDDSIKSVLHKVKISLSGNAKWIVTDFVNDKRWHNLLLKVMYTFFLLVSGITSKKLPHWKNEMLAIGANEFDSKQFYKGFIETKLYQF
jgi:tRNA (cmo5U34)-methyltransferase